MAWRLFRWGSRGLFYDTGLGVYVAHIFIPRAVQITLFGHASTGEELLHTFHAETTNPLPTASDCDHIAAAVAAWVIDATDGYKLLCNDLVQFDRVLAQSIAEFEGPFAEHIIGDSGTQHGPYLPDTLCMNVKKGSNAGGRSRRGYFATWPATVANLDTTDPNRFDPAYVTLAIRVFTALKATLGTGGFPLVIASRARATLYPVTSISVVTPAVRDRHSRAEGIGR